MRSRVWLQLYTLDLPEGGTAIHWSVNFNEGGTKTCSYEMQLHIPLRAAGDDLLDWAQTVLCAACDAMDDPERIEVVHFEDCPGVTGEQA